MPAFFSQMLANHFLVKLLLTPVIIILATLVSRRWGEGIGGLMIGLPLTSAPVSYFFAVEQGRLFAAGAALSAILGLVPVTAFCVCYGLAAPRLRWGLAAAVGIAAYLLAVGSVSLLKPGLGLVIVVVPVALLTGLFILGKPKAMVEPIRSPWWDLPLRIVIATTILIGITTAASLLGPKWSGLLSPFPVFTFVMVFFLHRQGGAAPAGRFVRGVVRGLFGYLAFFLVISLLLTRDSLPLAYGLAALAALGVNGLSLL
jgi:hypothetical protein